MAQLSFERYDKFFYGIAIAALWFLLRPYTGIIHDSTIYIGRALADLFPSSIGQQLSYAYDGQSQFSVAPRLFALLVDRFGVNIIAITLTIAGLTFWIAAATFLLSRFLDNRLLFAGLLCLCGMPSSYGGDWIFHWAEPFATPRSFAEAASLTAIGLLVERRLILSGIFAAVAFAIHPIMAFPAIGLGFALRCETDRRWLWCIPVVGVAIAIAAAVGLPIVDRLVVFPDAKWLEVMGDESKQVLLSHWYPPSWSLIACQFVTVALAYYCTQGAVKRIAAASIVIAALGLVITLIWPSLLILQAQIWRALWLLSFFAIAFLPLVVGELWTKGRCGQGSVALLLAGWMLYAHPFLAAPALIGAFGLAITKIDTPLPRWALWICWIAAFGALQYLLVTTVPAAISFYNLLPDGIYGFASDSVAFGFQFPILLAVATVVALGWTPRLDKWARSALWLGTIGLALITLTHWDRRSKFSQALDEGTGGSELKSEMRTGNVFWLTGYIGDVTNGATNAWLWTGRPNWWDGEQGAGVVFNRRLALESDRRVQLLRKAGLLSKEERHIGTYGVHPPLVTQNVLDTLCVSGGPDWIVAPIDQTAATVRIDVARIWRAPAPAYMWDVSRKKMIAHQRYAIFNCDTLRGPQGGAAVSL